MTDDIRTHLNRLYGDPSNPGAADALADRLLAFVVTSHDHPGHSTRDLDLAKLRKSDPDIARLAAPAKYIESYTSTAVTLPLHQAETLSHRLHETLPPAADNPLGTVLPKIKHGIYDIALPIDADMRHSIQIINESQQAAPIQIRSTAEGDFALLTHLTHHRLQEAWKADAVDLTTLPTTKIADVTHDNNIVPFPARTRT